MTAITTRIIVASDGTMSAAPALPAGEYLAQVEVASGITRASRPFRVADLPQHNLKPLSGWPSFSRDEIYGDEGR